MEKIKISISPSAKESLTPELEKLHRVIIVRFNDKLVDKGYRYAMISTLGGVWGKGYKHIIQPVDTMHVIVFSKRKLNGE